MKLWRKSQDSARTRHDTTSVFAEARTHRGHVRQVNEDRFLSLSDCGLWAVADGMGGHKNGDAAASIVISALEDRARSEVPLDDFRILESLAYANRTIARFRKPEIVSGATIVAAHLTGAEMTIYWAGDSRAYKVNNGRARLLTKDHSVVQELVDAGVISDAEAKRHPQANVITRALGVDPKTEIAVARVPFRAGDSILLCSDGLSRTLDESDFATPSPSLNARADELLANALARDGTDNATLVIVERRRD